jgi:hypothetical protein
MDAGAACGARVTAVSSAGGRLPQARSMRAMWSRMAVAASRFSVVEAEGLASISRRAWRAWVGARQVFVAMAGVWSAAGASARGKARMSTKLRAPVVDARLF